MTAMNYNPALVQIATDAIRTAITGRLGIHGKSLTDVAGEMTWIGIGRQVLEALADAETESVPQVDHDPRRADEPPIHDLVAADLQDRLRVGIETYGEPLTVHTAIDPLVYAYEEALDLACYLRQEIELRKRATR